jgi:3'(2'), 5'-bisphosphate nucleotidase
MIVLPSLLDAALHAVATACSLARAIQQGPGGIGRLTKADASPVTVADFAVQALISRHLRQALGTPLVLAGEESPGALLGPTGAPLMSSVLTALRPHWPEVEADLVLTELAGGGHDGSATGFWTLDPIDGTKGFLRHAQYAIALAYIKGGEPILGVLGCPNLAALPGPAASVLPTGDPVGAIFYATQGGGAFVSRPDRPTVPLGRLHAHCPDPRRLRLLESVESSHSRADAVAAMADTLGLAVTHLPVDSQCKYALLAAGRGDAFLRLPPRPDYVERIWDHAAGAVLATEAGAVVSDARGARLDFRHGTGLALNYGICCAHPIFHPRLISAIATLGLVPAR